MLELMIIGGGKMGRALAHAALDSGSVKPGSLGIVEVSSQSRSGISSEFPDSLVTAEPVAAKSTLLAVKPGEMESVCMSLLPEHKNRIVSIAAGVSTRALEVWLGGKPVVIRAMPNTPATVAKGMTAVCGGRYASEADIEWALSLMASFGAAVRVKESQFDAVTAVSGSGPAYVFLIAEAMIDAAIAEGLPLDLATELVVQTIYGSGAMLAERSSTPTRLRQDVTSPGGTTAAALAELEDRALRSAVARAVHAAKERSQGIAAELFRH